MKVTMIKSDKEYRDLELVNETVLINFNSTESNLASQALYYLICGIDKMELKEYSDLDFITSMQVDSRIDHAIELLNKMRKIEHKT